MGLQEKTCSKCGIKLSRENFKWYRAKNYIWKCNECIRGEKRIQAKKYRSNNKGLLKDRSTQYNSKLKKENPIKYTCIQMLSSSRKRAYALNMDNNLTSSFLISIAPKTCPVLGLQIKYGGGEKTKSSASLDRIDSTKGYTMDNVQIISNLANMMKNEATEDEMIKFANWVHEKIKNVSK